MGVLRFYLAISVVLAHLNGFFGAATFKLLNGAVAVQLFFIISGYYMSLVLNSKYNSLVDFYYNRFLRLFPSYWFVLTLACVGPLVFGYRNFAENIIASPTLTLGSKALLLISSIGIFGSDVMMYFYQAADGMQFTPNFLEHPEGQLWLLHVNPPAWSLPLEIYFYLLAPFIVRRPRILMLIIVLSLFFRCLFYTYFYANDPWSYRFFPFEIATFSAGALAYRLRDQLRPYGRTALQLSTLYLVAYSFNFIGGASMAKTAILLLGYGIALPYLFELTRTSKIDRFIGDLSYPIYIVHFPLFACLSQVYPDLAFPTLLATLVCVVVAILIQIFFQVRVETKFKRRIVD